MFTQLLQIIQGHNLAKVQVVASLSHLQETRTNFHEKPLIIMCTLCEQFMASMWQSFRNKKKKYNNGVVTSYQMRVSMEDNKNNNNLSVAEEKTNKQ